MVNKLFSDNPIYRVKSVHDEYLKQHKHLKEMLNNQSEDFIFDDILNVTASVDNILPPNTRFYTVMDQLLKITEFDKNREFLAAQIADLKTVANELIKINNDAHQHIIISTNHLDYPIKGGKVALHLTLIQDTVFIRHIETKLN